MQSIGNRMKENYEDRCRHYLARRVPLVVRVDGKAFHTFTRSLERPFDQRLVDAMVRAATAVAGEMQGCKAAYIQSDEASFLLTDYDTVNTQAWFDYNKSKVESIAASTMTYHFCQAMGSGPALFDARSFSIPREEVCNYFLWRMKDWERNSVSMYCGSFFSHRQMHGKSKADQHVMLHSAGKNWATDLTSQLRNGTWLVDGTVRTDIRPHYAEVAEVLDRHINCDSRPSLEEHCQRAAETVATWPKWKQGILGDSSKPCWDTPRKPVDNGVD